MYMYIIMTIIIQAPLRQYRPSKAQFNYLAFKTYQILLGNLGLLGNATDKTG
jgi:hypothetical protein